MQDIGENKSNHIKLLDLLDLSLIQKLQDGFTKATGVASVITTPEGYPITNPSNFCRLCNDVIRKTEKGLLNCFHSDAVIGRPNPDGPIIQQCLSAGLWDGGASIYAGEHHIGNWLIGQIRNEAIDESRVIEYAREIGADEEIFRNAYLDVPVLTSERFRDICDFLFLMANQLSSLAYEKVLQNRFIEERARTEKERQKLEQQLHHSRQLQIVGQFAGGIAHDFNNILTAILCNIDVLRLEITAENINIPEILDQLNQVYDASILASNLTRQILTFSKQQIISPIIIDISKTILQSESVIRRLLPENINFKLELDQNLSPIRADRSQFEQVIMNLIVNARDAMPNGGELHLKVTNVLLDSEFVERNPETVAGAHVLITLSDSGVGMSKEVIERIFEPFFTTKSVGKGTGLGLSTVYGIVKQAKGNINVYSESGKGTVFRIYWPVADGIPGNVGPEQFDNSIKGTESILLCEDSEPIRLLAERILKSAGYKVLSASNGSDALKLLESNPSLSIDLLVTDVIMPEMNGRVLSEIVSNKFPGIDTLFTSGYTAEVISKQGILDPGVVLLEKPYSSESLLRAVRKIFNHE